MDKKLKRNRAMCLQCGDVIESKHVHDWVQCTCGDLFVDGGLHYLRRGFNRPEKQGWREMSEYEEV